MRPWKSTVYVLAIGLLGSIPCHSQEKLATSSMVTTYSAARVVDHQKELRLEVGPHIRLYFPPDTFSEDAVVSARLDVGRRQLDVTTRGGEPTRVAAQIRLALPDLVGGLHVEYDHQTDDGSWFEGTLVESAEEPMPQIVALTSSDLEPVALDRNTTILLSDNEQRNQRVRWTDLAYGDHVKVRYGTGRRATTIEAARFRGEGVVDRVSGDRLSLVGASNPLVINRHARFEDVDGKSFDLEDLHPEDRITLRLDAQTKEVWHIVRTSAATVQNADLVVTHDASGMLLPGDRVQITGTGAPGGKLTIDVVNVESNLRAEELIGEPGTYVLTYTVPRGIPLDQTQIVGRFELPNGRTHTVIATAPLVFTEAGAATGWGDPSDQQKPKAPAISSPSDGATIKDAITVSGTASPRSRVKVVIDYAVSRSIVLLGEGRLFEKELSADSRGFFTTGEIPAKVQSMFGGDTDYKVTATEVSSGGVESDPTIVYARRPD